MTEPSPKEELKSPRTSRRKFLIGAGKLALAGGGLGLEIVSTNGTIGTLREAYGLIKELATMERQPQPDPIIESVLRFEGQVHQLLAGAFPDAHDEHGGVTFDLRGTANVYVVQGNAGTRLDIFNNDMSMESVTVSRGAEALDVSYASWSYGQMQRAARDDFDDGRISTREQRILQLPPESASRITYRRDGTGAIFGNREGSGTPQLRILHQCVMLFEK